MAFALSDTDGDGDTLPIALKIIVAGGFGVGKTTLVSSVSEIQPLLTEEYLTDESVGVDDTSGVEAKATTTVAMDFGRITLSDDLVLYLFGTPGQDRFDFMWEILGEGMLGYILLVDSSRPDSLDEAVGILAAFRKMARVPFVVALNRSAGIDQGDETNVRAVLELGDEIPVVPCDATDRESVKAVLLALLYSVLDEVEAERATV